MEEGGKQTNRPKKNAAQEQQSPRKVCITPSSASKEITPIHTPPFFSDRNDMLTTYMKKYKPHYL